VAAWPSVSLAESVFSLMLMSVAETSYGRSSRGKRTPWWLVCLLGGLAPISVQAEEEVASAEVQAANLVRVITFDRNFEKRFRGKVQLTVLFSTSDAKSRAMADHMVKALGSVDPYVFGDHGFSVQSVGVGPGAAVGQAIGTSSSQALFVCVGMDDYLPEVMTVARRQQLITIGATSAYVAKGLSFGIANVSGKPKILVNQSSSRAEGTTFTAQLLKLAVLVDK